MKVEVVIGDMDGEKFSLNKEDIAIDTCGLCFLTDNEDFLKSILDLWNYDEPFHVTINEMGIDSLYKNSEEPFPEQQFKEEVDLRMNVVLREWQEEGWA